MQFSSIRNRAGCNICIILHSYSNHFVCMWMSVYVTRVHSYATEFCLCFYRFHGSYSSSTFVAVIFFSLIGCCRLKIPENIIKATLVASFIQYCVI